MKEGGEFVRHQNPGVSSHLFLQHALFDQSNVIKGIGKKKKKEKGYYAIARVTSLWSSQLF